MVGDAVPHHQSGVRAGLIGGSLAGGQETGGLRG